MAHIRKKFGDLIANQGNATAEEAVKRTAKLNAVEMYTKNVQPSDKFRPKHPSTT